MPLSLHHHKAPSEYVSGGNDVFRCYCYRNEISKYCVNDFEITRTLLSVGVISATMHEVPRH